MSRSFVFFREIRRSDEKATYLVQLEYAKGISDCFLQIKYHGDSAKIYVGDIQVGDHFFTGEVWEVGLSQFGMPEEIRIEILPLNENSDIYLQEWPKFRNGIACQIQSVQTRDSFHFQISI
jgi:hypothetical protein